MLNALASPPFFRVRRNSTNMAAVLEDCWPCIFPVPLTIALLAFLCSASSRDLLLTSFFLYTVPVCLLGAEFKSHHVVHDSLSNWDSSTSLLNPWPANVRRMASTHDDFGAPGRVRPLCQTSTNDDPTVHGKCLILLSFLLFLLLHFQNFFFLNN